MGNEHDPTVTAPTGRDHGIRDRIDRAQLYGLACVLVGVSQLPLAFRLADHYVSVFVVGSGGWLLIATGINLLQGREAFANEWTENERIAWLLAAVMVLFAIGVVAAAGYAILAR